MLTRKEQLHKAPCFSLGVHSFGSGADLACNILLCSQAGLVQAQCQQLVANVLLQLVLARPEDAELFIGLVQGAMEKTLHPINHLHFLWVGRRGGLGFKPCSKGQTVSHRSSFRNSQDCPQLITATCRYVARYHMQTTICSMSVQV